MKRALAMLAAFVALDAWQGDHTPEPDSGAHARVAALPTPGGFERTPGSAEHQAVARAALGVSAFAWPGPRARAEQPAPTPSLVEPVVIARPQRVREASLGWFLLTGAGALVTAQRMRQRRAH